MQSTIDHNSSTPLHAQVEQLLREMIREPRYQNGECLPDELTLADQLCVSRSTVREAIKRLVFEGLVERRRGIGTRVKPASVKTSLVAWPSFEREMEARGHKVQDFAQARDMVEANERVVRALQIRKGTKVTYLERLRGIEGEPAVLFRSWFHPRLGDMMDMDLDAPVYETIAERTQISAVQADETISAVAAAGDFATRLRVEEGSPLLVRERVVRDAGGRPMEFAIIHYRADRFSYTISIQRRQG